MFIWGYGEFGLAGCNQLVASLNIQDGVSAILAMVEREGPDISVHVLAV